MPERPAPIGREPQSGEHPRRRLEDVPVLDVAVREHVVQVVAERAQLEPADEVDRGRRDHFVVAVDEDQQRLLDVPRPRPQDDVAAADPLGRRQVLEQRHQPPAQRPGEDVVQVLRGRGLGSRVAALERPPGGADVAPRVEQAEQHEDAIAGPGLLLDQHLAQQARRRHLAAREEVVVERQELEELPTLRQRERRRSIRGRRNSFRLGLWGRRMPISPG